MLGKIGKVCQAGLRHGGIGQWLRVNAKTPSTLERLADGRSEAIWQVCQEAARHRSTRGMGRFGRAPLLMKSKKY
jgi:hypothetical protein